MAKKSQTVDTSSILSRLTSRFKNSDIKNLNTSLEVSEVCSTGIIALDKATGINGLPYGRIVEIYGAESAGKTTLALQAAGNAVRAGYSVGFVDMEHALNDEYAQTLGAYGDNFLYVAPNNAEEAFDLVIAMIEEGVRLVVVDSVAAMTPKAELDGDMEAQQVGLQARIMGKGMRKLGAVASSNNALVIFLNQIRMKVGVVYGSPETTPGGNALKFFASMRMKITGTQKVELDGAQVGVRPKITIIKNKLAPPFKFCEADLIFGKGFDMAWQVLDLGVDCGAIVKEGNTFYFNGEKIAVGRPATARTLSSNPELVEKIERAVRVAVGTKPE
jgi:recombination protein RecA